ncbi:Uncharacterised protein [Zhongshania aliphaticivorans]|uniref:Winged helix-turn-helix domain-containing protein n=1 Tax=Zhongshania aliphaticivorans TaxID=1470434 RepID=A0A5S9P2W0_9GAMM|nr:crosslink repair DNA glycosylase YcaQ family protein [Zhongshania aliphaticivorans]CAA0090244.1 Uncharacterised protein [Zhongshania aliphaticivorans]CAA0097643.1 Uncharacterised protein [Zhongshania aliphaticivorans]
MTYSLSAAEARKLILHAQLLPAAKPAGKSLAATLSAIEHLGYIQIDTISAIQRAHHHTLWNRNPRYQQSQLNELVATGDVFEYWSHAAAYLPMKDYRYTLIRKHAIASGEQRHWYAPDKSLMKSVLRRITEEGPLMAKDFEYKGEKLGEWRSKPAKKALESLFMQGDLMISGRENFHKVYDLSERVLPSHINTSTPSQEEYARYLIRAYLQANGAGNADEIAYLRKNTKPLINTHLRNMVENQELLKIDINDKQYYAFPKSLDLLRKPLARSKLAILSPFDNLLIQRKRMQMLFDFDYLIECYLPEHKRQYGYFSLPILWNGNLVARMDCKADRKTSTLYIRHLAIESSLKNHDGFFEALGNTLPDFMRFNNCQQLQADKTTPASLLPQLIKLTQQ